MFDILLLSVFSTDPPSKGKKLLDEVVCRALPAPPPMPWMIDVALENLKLSIESCTPATTS